MPASALAAIKERLDYDTYLASIRATAQDGVFYQKAPDDTDVTTGITIVFDHRGEPWDRTTETRMKSLTFGILIFGNSFAQLDGTVVPTIEDIIDDAEDWLNIAGHDSYNLEILSVRLGLEDHCDKFGNEIYMADIECQLDYQRVRKNSAKAFPS